MAANGWVVVVHDMLPLNTAILPKADMISIMGTLYNTSVLPNDEMDALDRILGNAHFALKITAQAHASLEKALT